MKVSGEYIVTFNFYNEDGHVTGRGQMTLSLDGKSSSETMKFLTDNIKIPNGSCHFQITGIYKL